MFQYGAFNECYTNVDIATGSITGTINGFETDGGLLSNCYYSGSHTAGISRYLTQGTSTEVHYDKAFYIESLFWTEDVWDFSETIYPILKWELDN